MIKIKDVNINYLDYGNESGKTIVLLHGWGQNSHREDHCTNRSRRYPQTHCRCSGTGVFLFPGSPSSSSTHPAEMPSRHGAHRDSRKSHPSHSRNPAGTTADRIIRQSTTRNSARKH